MVLWEDYPWEQDSIEQREEELIEWAAERWGDL